MRFSVRRLVVAVVCAASVAAMLGTSEAAARGGPEAAPPDAACAGISTTETPGRRSAPAGLIRNCVRVNQIQVMGTHNSYRLDATPEILEVLRLFDPVEASALEYRHAPLAEQFDHQGIRQIELDVFADPDGGLYAERPALDFLGLPNDPVPELFEPGFKVLHIQDIDFNSTCVTFVACLEQVQSWSDANRRHLPIAILVELKEAAIPDPLDLGFVEPLPFGPAELDALDAEIRSVFDADDLITPDDVRGDHATLEDAVRSGGWPTLREAEGRVLFLMNNRSARDDYLVGRPSLEGRVMFTNASPGEDDAAFVKVDDPHDEAHIQGLVADGYVVRTRSDVPTEEARSGDTTRLEAALASGAQWVSTDYPVPGMSEWSDYVARMPDGEPARCNPVTTGPRCRSGALER